LSQIIVHVDMDAFFANVELLYNSHLHGKPFGVRSHSSCAILLTLDNVHPKMIRLGKVFSQQRHTKLENMVSAPGCQVLVSINSPFPFIFLSISGFIAKKLCPDLIFVPINNGRYSEMSGKVMDIFKRYDPNMCPAGIDEGYLK
jgi:DNA polymerase kappa